MTTNSAWSARFAVAASAGAFLLAVALQSLLGLHIEAGVDIPCLPAGVRVIAVTVFGVAGASGLVLAGLAGAPFVYPDADPSVWLGLGLLNGLIPLLSLHLVRRLFGIGDHLLELSFRALMVLIALQSVLSPLAHQALFLATGVAPASLYNLLGMIVGDTVGAMLVLLLVALVWSRFGSRT